MEQLNILIVEDQPDESAAIKHILETNDFGVVSIAHNYMEAMETVLNKPVDIIILDVFLSEQPDGLNIAEAITAMPHMAKPIIFVTGSKEQHIFKRAKLTKPSAYILKPYNDLELIYAIELALERFYDQPNALSLQDENMIVSKDYLFIRKGKALKKVHTSEIIYIEVEKKYCNIITAKERFVILMSLVKFLELLDPVRFCRTHRNFIINTEKILEIIPQDNLILLEGRHRATLSGRYKDIIKKIRTLS